MIALKRYRYERHDEADLIHDANSAVTQTQELNENYFEQVILSPARSQQSLFFAS
jgi:putative alpha-1,2-mannosidase